MKKVLVTTIFAVIMISSSLFYVSCSKEENESHFKSENSQEPFSLINLQSSLNPFNQAGEDYYVLLRFTVDSINNELALNQTIDSTTFFSLVSSEGLSSSIELTATDESHFNTYFSSIEVNLINLIEFEEHLLDNVPDVSDELLTLVALAKWGCFFYDEIQGINVSQFETCILFA